MMERRFSPAPAAFVKARAVLIPIRAHEDYRAAFERRAEVILRIVEAAQQAGEVCATLPSRVIVQMLLGLVCEAQYEHLIADGHSTPSEVTDVVVQVFFNGVRPQPDGQK